MKHYLKIITILIFILSFNFSFAQDDLTKIYDSNFEQALIDLGYDDNIDGFVETANIENITELNITNKNINDLTGIENFISLQKLFCQNNNLIIIDLYNLVLLNELNCAYNNLIGLDLTLNLNLNLLKCNDNNLKYLNLTQNELLTSIEVQNNQLVYFDIKNGKNDFITTFNITNNPNVESISVDNFEAVNNGTNNFSTWEKDINVIYSNQTKMSCSGYTQIPDDNFEQFLIDTGVDLDPILDNQVPTNRICHIPQIYAVNKSINNLIGIEGFIDLITLNVRNNNLSNLNLSNNQQLITLIYSDNNVSNLNINNNINLRKIWAGNNNLSAINIQNNTSLTQFHIPNNNIQNINFFNHPVLWSINLSDNPITSLNVNNINNLKVLACNSTQLSNLDVSSNPNLERFECNENQLSNLDVSNNPNLERFECNDNQLSNLDVSNNPNLERFRCNDNQLSNLDVSNNPNLFMFNCIGNQITNLDIRNGNNNNINTHNFRANNNNLCYILVDNINYSTSNWVHIDDGVEFVLTVAVGEALLCGECQPPTSITTTNIGITSLTLNWLDTDPLPENGWKIEYSINADFSNPTTIIPIANSTPTSLDITGLEPNTTYYFRVRANCDGTNFSDWSSITNATTLECITPTIGNFTNIGLTSLTLNWQNTDPLPANGWEIEYSINADFSAPITTIPVTNPSTTSQEITGLDADTIYYFRVRANCDGTNFSDWVDTNTTTLACITPTITDFINISLTSLTLNWYNPNQNPEPQNGWEIEYSTNTNFNPSNTIPIVNPNTTNYDFTGLDPDTTYYFRVRANCDGINFSDWSLIANAATLSCEPPTFIKTSPTDTSVFLIWDDPDVTLEPTGGWEVTYGLSDYDPTINPEDGTTVFTYEPEITIEELIPSNAYDFWVRSLCSESITSEWVFVHIDTPCSKCTSFIPQAGKEYVVSAWVKENWSTQPSITMNPDSESIKSMINDLIVRYNTNLDNGQPICPNGTVVNSLYTMNGLIGTTNEPFHEELLQTIATNGQVNGDDLPEPGIYNFRYNDDGNESRFEFQFTKGELVFTDNLLLNPGAESIINSDTENILYWNHGNPDGFESIISEQCNNVPVIINEGDQRFFSAGVCHASTNDSRLYQDVSVANSNYLIDNGDCILRFGGWTYSDEDLPIIVIKYLNEDNNPITDSNGVPIQVYLSDNTQNVWNYISEDTLIPIKTKKIRFELFGDHINGTHHNAYFDNVFLKIGTYTDSNNLQTFDVDCYDGNGGYTQNQINNAAPQDQYPYVKNHYKITFGCGINNIENKYKYAANTFKSTNIITPINLQKYTYSHTYVQLTFLDNENNIVVDFTDEPNRKYYTNGDIIDGWQRIQGVFKVPADTYKVKIELVNDHQSDAYFDDVRIFPKDGNMKSFVYDQKTQRLMAELDENNYATFYEYDKEGGLIRVKKETEKGVFTIQETRSGNVKKE